MTQKLPEPTPMLTAAEASVRDRLEAKIDRAMTDAGKVAGEALRVLRDERLYRLTHASFERYVLDRFGLSKATAHRMMKGPETLARISPSANPSSQVNVDQNETKLPNPQPLVDPPSAVRSPPGATAPLSGRSPSALSACGERPGPSPAPPERALTERQVLDWLTARSDQENRAIGPPFRPAWEREALRLAAALGVDGAPSPRRVQPWRRTADGEVGPGTALAPKRPSGRVIKPEQRATDPMNCRHPKMEEQKLGYIVRCGACGTKLR